jgi:hypothetical protein
LQLRQLIIVLLAVSALARPTGAQEEPGPAIPLADAKGRTGVVRVTLAERSPLSADIKALAKRIGLVHPPVRSAATPPAAPPDLTDYDLAKETFYVYVPPTPGDDGKYGLMVGRTFVNHSFVPQAWRPVLDARHLIWICNDNNGDDRPAAQQVGVLLDAAHGVGQVWPVDPDRIYLAMVAVRGPVCGTAFYYPDVFDGEIQAVAPAWFGSLKGFERPPLTYPIETFPAPQSKDLSLAKTHSRFFLAELSGGDGARMQDQNDIILRHGFKQMNFKYVKAEQVSQADMPVYSTFAANWFDHGVAFLDAPLAELRVKAKPTPSGKAPPRPAATPAGG